MAARSNTRASGVTPAAEATKEEAAGLTEPTTAQLPDERERRFRTPGFHRMRTAWNPEDLMILAQAERAIEDRLIHEWTDAYDIISQVYDLVRKPQVDANGEPLRDRHGFIVWERTNTGGYVEDFSKMTRDQKEHFLFLVTTRMFEFEQRAQRAWLESMLAKAQFEERFAASYDHAVTTGGAKDTIEGRTAVANTDAMDERYFAIFLAGFSRRCDAIVRSLNTLGQRLRDALTM